MTQARKPGGNWRDVLGLPKDQVVPCLVTYVCTRYHGKSFARRLAQRNKVSLWQSLMIGIALLRWKFDQKRDPWGELGRVLAFAEAWKDDGPEGSDATRTK